MAEATGGIRRTRSKKTTAEALAPEKTAETISLVRTPAVKTDPFKELSQVVVQLQEDFNRLEKEMAETRQSWMKEQQEHERQVRERDQEEELARRRQQETYTYDLERRKRQGEDEFADKKAAWEKQLRDQQDILEQDHLELENLRQLAASFEAEKGKAVEGARAILQKELTASFAAEQKLKDQEFRAKEEILNLKISNLTLENTRQKEEIESLKRALEIATAQVKDIAVKVIESGSAGRSAGGPEANRT